MNQNSSEQDTTQKIGTFASLRIHNYRMLFTGTTLSNAAQWIQQVTLNWLIYDISGSGTLLGTVNLVRSIAAIAMIPAAGILIDRLKRRRLMMFNNNWQLVITAGFGILLLMDLNQMVYVFIFAILGGVIGTTDNTLRQVLVFDLLPRYLTPNGMALIQTGWSLMRSLGPGLGGFLLLWVGAGGNFMIQAGAYALIIFTIMKIHFPKRTITSTVKSSPLENIKEGLRYIRNERVTRTIMMLGFVLPLLIIPIFTVLPPIYAVEVFGDDSGRILGFLMASVGLGGIVGGFVTASLGRMERRGLLQLGSLFLLSLSLVGFALTDILAVSLLFLVLSGFFEIIFLTTNQTLLQLSIPDDLRGRVTSVVNLNMALQPLGGLIAGAGSDLLGGPKMITIGMAGLAAFVVVIVLFISPTIRNYRLSQAIKPDGS
ncbi:MAG: MFS transporter [Dehalococcoidales bacterium]|nr:MAG: MFS transporter [Dehalococcoidales bacterium]